MNSKIFFKLLVVAAISVFSYLYIVNQTKVDRYVNSLGNNLTHVVISDITKDSFIVSWRTQNADSSELQILDSKKDPDTKLKLEYLNHTGYRQTNSVKVTGSVEEQVYYIKIIAKAKPFDMSQPHIDGVILYEQSTDKIRITLPQIEKVAIHEKNAQPISINSKEINDLSDSFVTLYNVYEPTLGVISYTPINSPHDVIDISKIINPDKKNFISYKVYTTDSVQTGHTVIINPDDYTVSTRLLTLRHYESALIGGNLVSQAYAESAKEMAINCCLMINESSEFIATELADNIICGDDAVEYDSKLIKESYACNTTYPGVCCISEGTYSWVPNFDCKETNTSSESDYQSCMDKNPNIAEKTISIKNSGPSITQMDFFPTLTLFAYENTNLNSLHSSIANQADWLCVSSNDVAWNCSLSLNDKIYGLKPALNKGDYLFINAIQPFDFVVNGY